MWVYWIFTLNDLHYGSFLLLSIWVTPLLGRGSWLFSWYHYRIANVHNQRGLPKQRTPKSGGKGTVLDKWSHLWCTELHIHWKWILLCLWTLMKYGFDFFVFFQWFFYWCYGILSLIHLWRIIYYSCTE